MSAAPDPLRQLRLAMDEFPAWDATLMPTVPPEWTPTSWHNDACPSWRVWPREEDMPADPAEWTMPLLVVFADWLDPAGREIPGPRFTLAWLDPDGGRDVLSTDDWDELLRAAAGEPVPPAPARAVGLLEQLGRSAELDDLDEAVRALQDLLGQTDGGFAAGFFSDLDEDEWPELHPSDRHHRLYRYVVGEIVLSLPDEVCEHDGRLREL